MCVPKRQSIFSAKRTSRVLLSSCIEDNVLNNGRNMMSKNCEEQTLLYSRSIHTRRKQRATKCLENICMSHYITYS